VPVGGKAAAGATAAAGLPTDVEGRPPAPYSSPSPSAERDAGLAPGGLPASQLISAAPLSTASRAVTVTVGGTAVAGATAAAGLPSEEGRSLSSRSSPSPSAELNAGLAPGVLPASQSISAAPLSAAASRAVPAGGKTAAGASAVAGLPAGMEGRPPAPYSSPSPLVVNNAGLAPGGLPASQLGSKVSRHSASTGGGFSAAWQLDMALSPGSRAVRKEALAEARSMRLQKRSSSAPHSSPPPAADRQHHSAANLGVCGRVPAAGNYFEGIPTSRFADRPSSSRAVTVGAHHDEVITVVEPLEGPAVVLNLVSIGAATTAPAALHRSDAEPL